MNQLAAAEAVEAACEAPRIADLKLPDETLNAPFTSEELRDNLRRLKSDKAL